MKQKAVILLTLILILGFKSSSDFKLDLQVLKNKFPHIEIKNIRIADSLTQASPVDKKIFTDLFQHFTTKPPIDRGECGCPIRSQIFKSKEYLISHQGILTSDFRPSLKFDIVTVLQENKERKVIYWLAYANSDFYEEHGLRFNKGELANVYLSPTLAENYKTDSLDFESYSSFLEIDIIHKTTIINNRLSNQKDSLIEIIRMCPYDMAGIMDQAKYCNDSCIIEFSNNDLKEKYRY